ncbi:MAG TPA: hypothetical protein VL523_17230 [Terriglobia bacterium]|nr:hypothetical protein [Terriglobia bacterium]
MNAKRVLIRFSLCLALAAILAGAGARRASADTIKYIIDVPNSDLCSNPITCANPGPYGLVTVDVPVSGGPADFTVSMYGSYGIAGGGPAFAFNIDDAGFAGLFLSNLTPGFDLDGTDKQFDGFGRFSVVLSGPAPAGHPPSELTFEVGRTGGFSSAALFASDGTFGASEFFGAHVIPVDGKTGFAGGSDSVLSTTPEPVALLLTGSGLLALALIGKMRLHAQR